MLLSENGVMIDSLTYNLSRQEKEISSLKTQLAEKEKEHHQSRITVHHLQMKLLHCDPRMMGSAKKELHNIDLSSDSYPMIELERINSQEGSTVNITKHMYTRNDNQKRKPLSLDQRIMRDRRKGTFQAPRVSKLSIKSEIEMETVRVRFCAAQVDKTLERQYGEIQKLLLSWKATDSDQLFRIWTF